MSRPVKRLLFWTPRVLCVLFALYLSIFSVDVFQEGYGFRDTIVALLMHLIPSYVVVLVLVISWRWGWVGAILFVALAVLYVVLFWDPSRWQAYLMISGPLVLIGILFLLNWLYRAELRGRS